MPQWKRPKRYRPKPSDVELSAFLLTRDPRRVAKEAFVESQGAARERIYDETTDWKLAVLRDNHINDNLEGLTA